MPMNQGSILLWLSWRALLPEGWLASDQCRRMLHPPGRLAPAPDFVLGSRVAGKSAVITDRGSGRRRVSCSLQTRLEMAGTGTDHIHDLF
ncbi:hypothetical protein B0H63DRAFT_255392 [Podospora didyma]|uniref:Secreted protein n=1 Tax=Podospora didyma TaxID=330526 RepID=A0AAE0KET9_9PEZI|nr:hypothetical protein B0H63DRAFT_255392 [Podospora didyma]